MWEKFHTSLEKAMKILRDNQYWSNFYDPLVAPPEIIEAQSEEDEDPKHLVFLQYRGKVTDEYVRALNKLKAPCKPILTLRKLKTILPTLKVQVDKSFRSRIVYKLLCPRCQACYAIQGTLSAIKTIWEAHPTLWSVPLIQRQE